MARALAAGIALALAAGIALGHGQSVSVLGVSAQVRPSALIRFEAKTQVALSDADFAQGYVDLPSGTFFALNAGRLRPPVSVDLPAAAGATRPVELKGGSAAYRVPLDDERVVTLTLKVEL